MSVEFIYKILGLLGCNGYNMLIVDIMHEFELGMFKSVFNHVLCVLYVISQDTIEDV